MTTKKPNKFRVRVTETILYEVVIEAETEEEAQEAALEMADYIEIDSTAPEVVEVLPC